MRGIRFFDEKKPGTSRALSTPLYRYREAAATRSSTSATIRVVGL
jgi:hypothetical protein